MDFLILAVLCVGLVGSLPVPHYPLYGTYVTPRYLHRPAVFAPLPPHQRTAPASPPRNPQDLVIHNSFDYVVNPEAEPEAAQRVVQYYSKDGLGRVVFAYVIPSGTRFEALSNDGTVRGSYSYKDPTGKIVQMYYWDDGTGFYTMGNNLPEGLYTPEVQAARDRHFQLYKQALNAAIISESRDKVVKPQLQPNRPEESVAVAADSDLRADDTEVMPDYDDDSDAVAIENADFSYLREAHAFRGGDPEAARRQVAEVELPVSDLTLDSKSQLAIARIGADGFQYLVPVDQKGELSESQHAARYGAIPVAAVHDAQVSPAQSQGIDSHQVKPVLVRTGTGQSESS